MVSYVDSYSGHAACSCHCELHLLYVCGRWDLLLVPREAADRQGQGGSAGMQMRVDEALA